MLLCHFKYFHHFDPYSSSPATKWVFKLQALIHYPIACPFHPPFFPFLGHKWDYLSSFLITLYLWYVMIAHIVTFPFSNIKKNSWEILSNTFLFLMCFPRALELLQLYFSVVHCTFTSCLYSFYSVSYHIISVLTGIFVEFYPYLSTTISGTSFMEY